MKIHLQQPVKYLFIFTLLLSGCRKPESEFRLDQYEYAAGDAIAFENLSVRNKTSKWTIFNSKGDTTQNFEGKNPVIVIGVTVPDGAYKLRLTNYTRKEKKSSHIEQPFLVKTVRATMIINNSGGANVQKTYTVYVDNQSIGKSNASGQFVAELPVGMRLIKLVSPGNIHEKTYLLTQNNTLYINF